MKPMILANNLTQARIFARKQQFRPDEWIYLADLHYLRGTVQPHIYVLPGYDEKENAADLVSMAKARSAVMIPADG